MGFKVGDKVRITARSYSGINIDVNIEPYAIVTRVADHGAMLQRGECDNHYVIDHDNWHFFFENGTFEPIENHEPAAPRKMHPDDFVSAVNDFARDNRFVVSKIEFRGCTFNDTCLPFHQYSVA